MSVRIGIYLAGQGGGKQQWKLFFAIDGDR
jgi:hypothetical protein